MSTRLAYLACQDNPEVWFPETLGGHARRGVALEAAAKCAVCPAIDACRILGADATDGIWGGVWRSQGAAHPIDLIAAMQEVAA